MITEYQSQRINTDKLGNPTDQSVEFMITDDEGKQYQFRADISKDIAAADIPSYLQAHVRDYLFLIRLKEYRSNAYCNFEGEFTDNLERIEAWIAAGHKVQIGTDANDLPIYSVIEKQTIPNEVI